MRHARGLASLVPTRISRIPHLGTLDVSNAAHSGRAGCGRNFIRRNRADVAPEHLQTGAPIENDRVVFARRVEMSVRGRGDFQAGSL
jgi:hypothetical protein